MPSSSTDTIFSKAVELRASDVHLVVGLPLQFRIDGRLIPQTKKPVGSAEAQKFVKDVLGEKAFKRLQDEREIDASYALSGGERLRINCHFEKGNISMVARIIPSVIPTIEELHLEEIAPLITELGEGLVLFTGPTGSGKSTSLAALIQSINASRAENIITLEDPIEFTFPEGMGIIRQRQYQEDFLSFAEALRHILRQDPDIIMVGEMRDPETIAAALTLAETGHLVFATLHTPNTAQTVDRIIDVFPPHQQGQVRAQLSMSLKVIVAQRLLPGAKGGRVAQREVLVNTNAISNIIRDNRIQEIASAIQTGSEKGMVPFEKDAKRLLKEGLITEETYEWAAE